MRQQLLVELLELKWAESFPRVIARSDPVQRQQLTAPEPQPLLQLLVICSVFRHPSTDQSLVQLSPCRQFPSRQLPWQWIPA
jgi:hypothetical protein